MPGNRKGEGFCRGRNRRFFYISALDFGAINYLIQGYYDEKETTHDKLQKYKEGKPVLERFKLYGPDGQLLG
ncbi:hypothetical protein Tco_0635740 [Tanacetum coccineum]